MLPRGLGAKSAPLTLGEPRLQQDLNSTPGVACWPDELPVCSRAPRMHLHQRPVRLPGRGGPGRDPGRLERGRTARGPRRRPERGRLRGRLSAPLRASSRACRAPIQVLERLRLGVEAPLHLGHRASIQARLAAERGSTPRALRLIGFELLALWRLPASTRQPPRKDLPNFVGEWSLYSHPRFPQTPRG